MPLEPHRSEACRSCQPMHVLSFGEGRKVVVWYIPMAMPPHTHNTPHPIYINIYGRRGCVGGGKASHTPMRSSYCQLPEQRSGDTAVDARVRHTHTHIYTRNMRCVYIRVWANTPHKKTRRVCLERCTKRMSCDHEYTWRLRGSKLQSCRWRFDDVFFVIFAMYNTGSHYLCAHTVKMCAHALLLSKTLLFLTQSYFPHHLAGERPASLCVCVCLRVCEHMRCVGVVVFLCSVWLCGEYMCCVCVCANEQKNSSPTHTQHPPHTPTPPHPHTNTQGQHNTRNTYIIYHTQHLHTLHRKKRRSSPRMDAEKPRKRCCIFFSVGIWSWDWLLA